MKPYIKTLSALTLGLCSQLLAANESAFDEAKLSTILAAQSDKTKARYPYRNPLETLRFFLA